MTLLTYSLAAAVALSGVVTGALLALNTKEEMPTAKRYLPLLQKILFIAMVAVLLNHFKAGVAIKIITYAAVVFIILKKPGLDFYPLIAVVFFLLGQSPQGLFAISALVFLYGFPTGSLFVIHNRRMGWLETIAKAKLKYGIFLIEAVILQLLYSAFALKTIS